MRNIFTISILLGIAPLMACDDAPTADPPAPADTGDPRPDRAPHDAAAQDAAAQDAAPDATPDAAPQDAAQDADPPADAAEGIPCAPDTPPLCAAQGRPERVLCEAGRRSLVPCPPGQICLGEGRCLPDPATCRDGERICLDRQTPGLCVPGERWQPGRACREDAACSGRGECRSIACATTEANRSYLGCDYQAVDLPNLAFAPFGATPAAPLGVVIANPDRDTAARITVRDFDGRLAALVPEVTIDPPPAALGRFAAETVRTTLRDGAGALISQAFDQAQALEIPPGGLATLLLPTAGVADRRGVRTDAWRISADQPVAAYQFSPYCCNFSYTNDASLLLPTGALGETYIFVGVPSWNADERDADGNLEPFAGFPATLTVIGTQAATHVRVTLPPGVEVEPDPTGRSQRQGQTLSAVLADGETWTLAAGPAVRQRGVYVGQDLTGARIDASAPVAVFSGHECTYYPWDAGACDHLEEQLLPLDAWGQELLLAPPALRARQPALATETTYWKIVAGTDGTEITLGDGPLATLNPSPPGFVGVPDCAARLIGENTLRLDAGEYCELGTREALAVRATQPIQIMGIMSGQASVGFSFDLFGQQAGDPAIWLAPPLRQLRRSYTFLTPDTYARDYITVIIPDQAELRLDDTPIPLVGGRPVRGAAGYITLDLEVSDGPHRIEATAPFGLLVYAYDDYVSYAYTGGLDLNKR